MEWELVKKYYILMEWPIFYVGTSISENMTAQMSMHKHNLLWSRDKTAHELFNLH